MNLLHLVDRLEELVGGAQRMPIGSRVMIDRRRLLDLIDQMRVAIPQEVREAQRMVSEQERLHREAEEEARLIVARAEEQATRLISEHEIMRQAERHAEDLTRQAEARLEQRVSGANDDIRDRIEESRRLTDQQMPLFPWSSQARGFFAEGRAAPEDLSDAELARCWYSNDNFMRLERARSLAAQKDVSATAVALAYVLHQPFPTFPIVGPMSPSETSTSLEALNVELTPAEVRWLDLRDRDK